MGKKGRCIEEEIENYKRLLQRDGGPRIAVHQHHLHMWYVHHK